MASYDININKIFFQKYLCQKRIGKGSFGTVYSGINTLNNQKIAIKTEKRYKNNSGTLETEAYRLIHLQGEGVPKIYCYGNNHSYNILIQELLGKSLENIFNSLNKKFSLKTVCVLGIEMIKRIKFIHSRNHIHRDIKPDNFMIGRDDKENKIYIIDFGLSKKFYSTSKQEHIKFCKGKSLIGTARYCGRNAHKGYEQSRRDDIESIGYVLMYFLLGVLPWQGLKIKQGEDQFEKIGEKKIVTPFEDLCKNQPEEFVLYFKHVDKLQFEEEPNYDYLIGLFQQIINKNCNNCFYDFDWKKTVCTHFSVEQELQQTKSRDISLLVNKNGLSQLNESRNMEIKNEDNYVNEIEFRKQENTSNENNDNNFNLYPNVNSRNKKKSGRTLSMNIQSRIGENDDNNNNNNNNKNNKNNNTKVKSSSQYNQTKKEVVNNKLLHDSITGEDKIESGERNNNFKEPKEESYRKKHWRKYNSCEHIKADEENEYNYCKRENYLNAYANEKTQEKSQKGSYSKENVNMSTINVEMNNKDDRKNERIAHSYTKNTHQKIDLFKDSTKCNCSIY